MSFDDPDEDYDERDPDENWHWYDDEPTFVKEEPNCYSCNDAGGRCCEPTRLDVLRCRLSSWYRLQRAKLRRRRASFLDEPPFRPPGEAVDITIVEIKPTGEFGGHVFEYEQHSDLFKCVNPGCGAYEIVARTKAREQGTGEITQCPAASATDASEGTCPHGNPLDDETPCARCENDYVGINDQHEEG